MKRVLRTFLFSGIFWGTIALGFASQLRNLAQFSWAEAARFTFIEWGIWALLTPLVFLIAQRFPIEATALRRTLGIQILAALVSLTTLFVWRETFLHGGPPPPFQPPYPPPNQHSFENRPPNHDPEHVGHPLGHKLVPVLFALPVVLLIQTIAHAALFYRRAQERTQHTLALEQRLTEAKLQAITAQLQPHFLFNAINTAASMVYEEPQLADRMLVAICDFLRDTLDLPLHQDISLEEEIQLVRRFLLIQQIRFADRLDVQIQIPSELWSAAIPPLCLQPLVENAFKHGLEKVRGPLLLLLRASADSQALSVEVCDNGPGPEPSERPKGLGLANIRARLDTQFGNKASLQLRHERGCIAAIQLPLRIL